MERGDEKGMTVETIEVFSDPEDSALEGSVSQ